MNSEPLAARLSKGPLSLTQWIAIGRCIRRFHDAGVCHADLNAHNILLTPEQVYLIDFDRGDVAQARLVGGHHAGAAVSLTREGDAARRAGEFHRQDWHSLLAGYRESAGLPQASLT